MSSRNIFKVFLTKRVDKEINKLSSRDIKYTLNKIATLNYPFPTNLDIKALVGVKGFYRIRIGKVRVIFEVDQEKREIWIRKVDYRSRIYRF